MRIMPVGDSMTIGSAGEHTWRIRLWRHLTAASGSPVRMVGPHSALHEGSDAYADRSAPAHARGHLAAWGTGFTHHAHTVHDALRAHPADIALVSLGLMDLGFYTDPDQTAANVRLFVAAARRAAPGIRTVLLPVLPNIRVATDGAFAARVERFNELLAERAAELSTHASPLLVASAPPGWDHTRDTRDGTHPSPRGEHRIAAAFADTLHRAWEVGGAYPSPREERATVSTG
ncbi:GDSL-type esterase/lipase family protein [Streptomyces sp. TR06-5]|uniref:GDSL-type esterase/lipase family protein n=1 Tax=unclassified Streptomyces TaxID=2593676 RepID=UPI0039A2FDBC